MYCMVMDCLDNDSFGKYLGTPEEQGDNRDNVEVGEI